MDRSHKTLSSEAAIALPTGSHTQAQNRKLVQIAKLISNSDYFVLVKSEKRKPCIAFRQSLSIRFGCSSVLHKRIGCCSHLPVNKQWVRCWLPERSIERSKVLLQHHGNMRACTFPLLKSVFCGNKYKASSPSIANQFKTFYRFDRSVRWPRTTPSSNWESHKPDWVSQEMDWKTEQGYASFWARYTGQRLIGVWYQG